MSRKKSRVERIRYRRSTSSASHQGGGASVRWIPIRQEARPRDVRRRADAAADRAGQAAGLAATDRPTLGPPLRGARRRRKRRLDQRRPRAHQSAAGAHRRARQAVRPRGRPVVFSALRRRASGRERNGALRSLLVQSRRGRAGHGVLHQGAGQPVPRGRADLRDDDHRKRHAPLQVLAGDRARDAARPASISAGTIH